MKVLFIGCGNMGLAIAKGMLNSSNFTSNDIDVILPHNSKSTIHIISELGVNVFHEYPANQDYDMVIFAVKPITLASILPYYQDHIKTTSTVITSIAAGKRISFFEKFFPNHPIVRIMPNVNVQVMNGISGIYSNNKVTEVNKQAVNRIYETLGYVVWVDNEDIIDVIIGIAASSPAYVFQFMEHLAKCGIEAGLDEGIAFKIAEQVLIGSAEMLHKTGKSLQELRTMITSPNGTTLAALNEFNKEDKLYNLINSAVKAAIKRSKELSE